MQKKIAKRPLPVYSIALVLAIAVAWTLPFAVSATTLARYTTQGAMEATARVAGWDVVYSQQLATAIRHENITVFHTRTTATHASPTAVIATPVLRSGVTSRSFTILNNSQVTANAENIVLRYVMNDTTSPTAVSPTVASSSHSHGAYNITPNPTAGQRVNIGATSTHTIQIRATTRVAAQPDFAIRWYRVFFDALQVD